MEKKCEKLNKDLMHFVLEEIFMKKAVRLSSRGKLTTTSLIDCIDFPFMKISFRIKQRINAHYQLNIQA